LNYQRRYQERESERLKAWIEQARATSDAGRSLTIKRMEAMLAVLAPDTPRQPTTG
jgi:hypothetical protein